MRKINIPLDDSIIFSLNAGERVSLSGEIYTARDAAHKRLIELLDAGKPLPIDTLPIYYAGPCPALPNRPIGSVGPTTSARMDKYALRLICEGFRIMIGKGARSRPVIEAIHEHKGIYFSAVGGAGAYYSQFVRAAEVVAFDDLGPEAIYKLSVRDMPLIVAIDSLGTMCLGVRG